MVSKDGKKESGGSKWKKIVNDEDGKGKSDEKGKRRRQFSRERRKKIGKKGVGEGEEKGKQGKEDDKYDVLKRRNKLNREKKIINRIIRPLNISVHV